MDPIAVAKAALFDPDLSKYMDANIKAIFQQERNLEEEAKKLFSDNKFNLELYKLLAGHEGFSAKTLTKELALSIGGALLSLAGGYAINFLTQSLTTAMFGESESGFSIFYKKIEEKLNDMKLNLESHFDNQTINEKLAKIIHKINTLYEIEFSPKKTNQWIDKNLKGFLEIYSNRLNSEKDLQKKPPLACIGSTYSELWISTSQKPRHYGSFWQIKSVENSNTSTATTSKSIALVEESKSVIPTIQSDSPSEEPFILDKKELKNLIDQAKKTHCDSYVTISFATQDTAAQLLYALRLSAKSEPNQFKKIFIPEQGGFEIKLASTDYDALMGEGSFNQLQQAQASSASIACS